jgi:hypothetical protein
MQVVRLALPMTPLIAANNSAARTAMMAMTISNSTSVNPLMLCLIVMLCFMSIWTKQRSAPYAA